MHSTFEDKIFELINLKQEGEYWDFKRQWHENKADLLHDIICMANNLSDNDGYIIIGIDEENGNPWGVSFQRMYDMSNESHIFITEQKKDYLPLYKAKLMHQFDHRWNTFVNGEPKEVTMEQKEDTNFTVTPQYYVPYAETVLRTTSLDLKIVQALREAIASVGERRLLSPAETSRTEKKLRSLVAEKAASSGDLFASCHSELDSESDGVDWQKVYGSKELGATVFEVAEKLCPKYQLGYREITNTTNARTVIASILPFCGVGNKIPLIRFDKSTTSKLHACLLADFNSIPHDVVCRMKLGGTTMNYFYKKQMPVLPPSAYHEAAQNFIVPRVMALTYTATNMEEWAKALWNDSSFKMRLKMLQLNNKENEGITDEKFTDREFSENFLPPYIFDDAKRAVLRAELDAYYARLYGLTRTELQYILDPHSVMGQDYPSETFRVLKDNEFAKYGEYRTQRLVLEAWDRME